MQKLKEYLKIFFYAILLILVEFVLVFLFTLIFNLNTSLEIGTDIYQQNLNLFISKYKLLIAIINFVILIPFLLKKGIIKKEGIDKKKIFYYIFIGICVSLSYNLLLCGLNKIVYFTNLYDNISQNIVVNLITTGILGPILEELIFRGIIYNKLKSIHKHSVAAVVTGLIFGLLHGNLVQFIYTFFFNFILIKSYEKENNILIPIIIHISANSIITLLLYFIINLNLIFTFILTLCFVTILIILLKSMYKDQSIV